MQIVIKIPEEIYESSKRECEENDDLIIDTFTFAIGNGIPLEDIKAEIDTMADLSAKTNDKTLFGGLELALGIIDKHISGKE